MLIERVDPVILEAKRTVDKMIKQVNLLAKNPVLAFAGTWTALTQYAPGDIVQDGGSNWLALTKTINVTPVEGADWTKLGAVGGSAGLPELLGYAFANTTSMTNPDIAVDTLIPGMSVTFNLTSARDVRLTFEARAKKTGGGARVRLYDGATDLTTSLNGWAPFGTAWYSRQGAGGENDNQEARASMIINLASGSHTITAQWQAAGNLNAIEWGERQLVVEALS